MCPAKARGMNSYANADRSAQMHPIRTQPGHPFITRFSSSPTFIASSYALSLVIVGTQAHGLHYAVSPLSTVVEMPTGTPLSSLDFIHGGSI